MMTFLPLGGFLGAGKTTTALAVAAHLRAQGRRTAVVTNDQGDDLVDSQLARAAVGRVAEVTGGCLCCRFEDLAAVVTDLFDDGVDTVLAEAVGSCTDLQATVVRPLRRYHGAMLSVGALTAVVDPERYRLFARAWDTGAESDLAYLYSHQLAEADVIALNKADTLSPKQREALTADLARRFAAPVVPYSARSGDITALLSTMESAGGEGGGDLDLDLDLDLDYDRYAAAEAELAWLNGTYTVDAEHAFEPGRWIIAALESVASECADGGDLVGHVKLAVDSPAGLAKGSLTAADGPPRLDVTGPRLARTGRASFNLRVATDPDRLDRLAAAAVGAADAVCATRSTATSTGGAFRPAYPRPTHRIRA